MSSPIAIDYHEQDFDKPLTEEEEKEIEEATEEELYEEKQTEESED